MGDDAIVADEGKRRAWTRAEKGTSRQCGAGSHSPPHHGPRSTSRERSRSPTVHSLTCMTITQARIGALYDQHERF